MPANPLLKAGQSGGRKSAFRALEWAAMAQDKGHTALAAAWTKAAADRWDDTNYCQIHAEEYREKIRIARGGR